MKSIKNLPHLSEKKRGEENLIIKIIKGYKYQIKLVQLPDLLKILPAQNSDPQLVV
jgi:hypothetical protein